MSSDSLDAPLSAIWTGVAGSYDAYRPHTPTVLLDLLSQLARYPAPATGGGPWQRHRPLNLCLVRTRG